MNNDESTEICTCGPPCNPLFGCVKASARLLREEIDRKFLEDIINQHYQQGGNMEKTVRIELITEMLGTVPKDREVYSTYIETKKPVELQEEKEAETIAEEMEEKGWTGFHSDENGLFVYDYFIKGFFKNAGNVLKASVGVKNLRSKLTDYFFIFPRRIYLGKPIPDGIKERPLRAQTMQGPRVTLARSDYVAAGTVIEFRIKLLKHPEITIDLLKTLMEYGELQGLGQFRNGGYGRFKVLSVE